MKDKIYFAILGLCYLVILLTNYIEQAMLVVLIASLVMLIDMAIKRSDQKK